MKSEDDDLFAALMSSELSVRIPAVDRAAQDPARYAEVVVSLIRQFPSDAYFILERIGRFGSDAVPHLRYLLESTQDAEVRLTCALGLAHFREDVDLALLTDAIHTRSEYQHQVCRALVWLKATATIPTLLEELRNTTTGKDTMESDAWRVVSLVQSIRDLGGELAPEEVARLDRPGAPLEVSALFRTRA